MPRHPSSPGTEPSGTPSPRASDGPGENHSEIETHRLHLAPLYVTTLSLSTAPEKGQGTCRQGPSWFEGRCRQQGRAGPTGPRGTGLGHVAGREGGDFRPGARVATRSNSLMHRPAYGAQSLLAGLRSVPSEVWPVVPSWPEATAVTR